MILLVVMISSRWCYSSDYLYDVFISCCKVREKVFIRKSESEGDASTNSLGRAATPRSPVEDQKMTKEINELSKMTDSGAAAVILRDLRKKRSESPTLDPRNASRTPSAATEPSNKPRYDTPYFAC
jgi:hypothetical protein